MKTMSKDATKKKTTQVDANAVFLSKLREEKHASNKKRVSTSKSKKMGKESEENKNEC